MLKNASQQTRRTNLIQVIACLLLLCLAFLLCACNKKPQTVSAYKQDNNFEYEVTDSEDAVTYAPQNFAYYYGVVLYSGILATPADYDYIATALAKQGYLVVIPKFETNSYTGYKTYEPAFTEHQNMGFFVIGHEWGGGAAVRRGSETDGLSGVILLSPVCFSRQVTNEDGSLKYDAQGNVVKIVDSIKQKSIPTLLLETGESTRTQEIKSDALSRLNADTLTAHDLTGSTEEFMSSLDFQEQMNETVSLILSFLKTVSR